MDFWCGMLVGMFSRSSDKGGEDLHASLGPAFVSASGQFLIPVKFSFLLLSFTSWDTHVSLLAFKHSCWHQNLTNAGKKSHLGPIVLRLKDQIWQIHAQIWNLGELIALTCTCSIPAVPWWENHFPDELPGASLPVPGCLCDLFLVPCVPRECLILLDRWLHDLQSPQNLPDDFCLQQPLPCLFLGPDYYCLAFFCQHWASCIHPGTKSAHSLRSCWLCAVLFFWFNC